jgi:hypothetical protein
MFLSLPIVADFECSSRVHLIAHITPRPVVQAIRPRAGIGVPIQSPASMD